MIESSFLVSKSYFVIHSGSPSTGEAGQLPCHKRSGFCASIGQYLLFLLKSFNDEQCRKKDRQRAKAESFCVNDDHIIPRQHRGYAPRPLRRNCTGWALEVNTLFSEKPVNIDDQGNGDSEHVARRADAKSYRPLAEPLLRLLSSFLARKSM